MSSEATQLVSREDALEGGIKTFFTGITCGNGHISRRFTRCGSCAECKLDNQRKRRRKDPEGARERVKRWRTENRWAELESARKRYAKNPEPKRESIRKWAKKNPERYCAYTQNWRARFLGAEGSHTPAEIEQLLVKQQFKCAETTCRDSIKGKYHRDHVMPLSLGGSNWISNIQLLCPACNIGKGAKHPTAWAQVNGRLL